MEPAVRILLIEDHAVMRDALLSLLGGEPDLTVASAVATAEAGLEELEGLDPDLVLVDVSLPGMSGIEFVRTVRASHPGLPLVMLSGHEEGAHIRQALDAGATAYVVKGNAATLASELRRVMREAR